MLSVARTAFVKADAWANVEGLSIDARSCCPTERDSMRDQLDSRQHQYTTRVVTAEPGNSPGDGRSGSSQVITAIVVAYLGARRERLYC